MRVRGAGRLRVSALLEPGCDPRQHARWQPGERAL